MIVILKKLSSILFINFLFQFLSNNQIQIHIIVCDTNKMYQSEKEKGNACFKLQKYSEAVKHYQQYVQDEHIDNKNAYFNLSLCYSKLKKPIQSIEAAEKALEIDKSYVKCYYRLAHQYQKLAGKDYEIFINAAHFQRVAASEQHSQKQEMKKFCHDFRDFYLKDLRKVNKIKNEGKLIQESAFELPEYETETTVDKTLDEWLSEWNQDIQSEEAKWVEIEYIMQQIDYDHGLNLAYFYINQLKDFEVKQKTIQKLKELKSNLGKQKIIGVEELDIDLKEDMREPDSDSSQEIHNNTVEIKQERNPEKGEEKNEAKQIKQQVIHTQEKIFDIKAKKNMNKDPKKMLEQMKRKVQKMNPGEGNLRNQTFKELKQEIANKKLVQQKSQEIKNTTQVSKQEKQKDQDSSMVHQKISKVNKSRQYLENIYEGLTAELSKSKDIFTDVYRCVVKALQDKSLTSSDKGWLMTQLRKRVKKFKRIMQATSENEQKIVFDLLKQNNLEQYSIDLAPLFYTV